jgi:MFS family permease
MPGDRVRRHALTVGETGSAGGQTLLAALLPVLLAPHAPSTFWIGAVIATEGLFALVLPYVAGALSDSMHPRFAQFFGRRGALLALSMPFMAAALLLIPFRDSFWSMAGIAVVYFAALHAYSTPLRAMLIDATPTEHWGSVQGAMGATHLGGVTFGLVAGGLLYSVYQPLPFIVGAGLLVVTTAITLYTAWKLRLGAEERHRPRERWDIRRELDFWRELLRDADSRWFLMANVLWNAGTEGIRPYLFLFATVVLGIAVQTASLAMLAFLGAAGIGSIIVGRIGDRAGRARILLIGALITGTAMLPGFFVRDLAWLLVLLVPAGLGAAALVALPYPVFATLEQDLDTGRSTGAFYMSVGVARLIAPLLVGAAIDIAAPMLPGTSGYPVMWPIAGLLVLGGAAVLGFTRRKEGRGRRGEA